MICLTTRNIFLFKIALLCWALSSANASAHLSSASESKNDFIHKLSEEVLKSTSVHQQLITDVSSLLTCDVTRQRKEYRDFTNLERQIFRRALAELINSGDWQLLVEFHRIYTEDAHNGCFFLPWHRLYIFMVESMLRRYEPTVTLPYWDWTRDSNDPAMSSVWRRRWMGSATIPTNSLSSLGIQRDFTSGVSGSLNGFPSWSMIEQSVNHDFWPIFAQELERLHSLVHINIGGQMLNLALAPLDPVFYLHHTFVDYLWYTRQTSRNNVWEFSGLHRGQDICGDWNRMFPGFNEPLWRGVDLSCISYQPTQVPGVNGWTAGRTKPVGQEYESKVKCEDPEFLALMALTPESCAILHELDSQIRNQ